MPTLVGKPAPDFRLEAVDHGNFKNLTLVGDYPQCGINAGCMEGAIISGAMGARAICGFPTHVPGEGSGLFE